MARADAFAPSTLSPARTPSVAIQFLLFIITTLPEDSASATCLSYNAKDADVKGFGSREANIGGISAILRAVPQFFVRWLVLLTILTSALLGCADRSLAGSYTGRRQVGGPPHIAGTLAKVELVLERDGTFTLLNTSLTFEGRWDYIDGRVRLEVKSALGRPTREQDGPYLVPTPEGLELHDPHGVDPRPVVLRRL